MRLKQVLYFHLISLGLFLINILIATITGYGLHSSAILVICIGYYLSLLMGFASAKSINHALKAKTGEGIQYVLSLTGIFLVEMLVATISGLYIFIILVFAMNAPVVAEGKGYEIRLQPSVEWPPRYVLHKSNLLLEKHIGSMHANEDDFKIEGNIKDVVLNADSVEVVISGEKDTSIIFIR